MSENCKINDCRQRLYVAVIQEMIDAIECNGIDSHEMLDAETGAPRGKWHDEWLDRARETLTAAQ